MNIPVNHLKKFQKVSSHAKAGILPIHHYIRFGGGKIIKNVNSAFVEYTLPESNEEMLVDEDDLYSLLNETKSSFISITNKNGKIELNDGLDKIILQSPPVKDFLLPTPLADGESVELSSEFMQAIAKASLFAQFIKDAPTYYGYVHINNKSVCAGDGIIAFHCPVDEDVEIVLDHKNAQIISKHNIHSFQTVGNFQYFYGDDVLFGFAKSEIGWVNIKRIFDQKRNYSFTLSASDIKSFNSLSLQLSKTSTVTISDGKFEMNDMLLDKHHEREVAGLKISTPFTYNPERMNTLISGLDIEELEFSDSEPAYFISTKESKETAIISKIQK